MGGGWCLHFEIFRDKPVQNILWVMRNDGLGYLNIRGQIIQTVKYADDLILMAKEGTVLQGMIDKLIVIGSCYGMGMNVEKTIKSHSK
jgi:hypothetical protein